ncbi:hypothetical protein SNE40_019496 [Patella caerulea]|uniref:Small acidic protein n=1 Tax=Patella caerulea TaxID=87958 RepID=A0AAN8J6L0_PATCE
MSANSDPKHENATEEVVSKNKDNKEPEEKLEVHSANSWETAELGDDKRKSKFLRLMGAGKKKDHHGPIVIGDHSTSHGREKQETEKITTELELQFRQGLDHKLSGGARSHLGLGFQDISPPVEPAAPVSEKNTDTVNKMEPEKRKFEEKVENEDNNKPSAEKKMKFVKSSS